MKGKILLSRQVLALRVAGQAEPAKELIRIRKGEYDENKSH